MTLAPLNMASVLRASAHAVPLADASVSLIVSSPPYWALRVYEDEGEVYPGQVGSEDNPAEFLRNLWRAMDEAWRVLRDDGVAWINLGDKYAGSGGHNNAGVASSKASRSGIEGAPQFSHQPVARTRVQVSGLNGNRPAKPPAARDAAKASRTPVMSRKQAEAREGLRDSGVPQPAGRASRRKGTRRQSPDRYQQGTEWARAKSLMGLPWAFVLGLMAPDFYRNHIDPPRQCRTCRGAGVVPVGLGLEECPGDCAGWPQAVIPHPQWVWRAEQVWDKPNGLPESVTDRPRRTHEVWLMVTKNGRYFAGMDDVREPYLHPANGAVFGGANAGPKLNERSGRTTMGTNTYDHTDPRGKMPGSVWRIASEPFADELYHLVDEGGRVVDAAELAMLNRDRGPLGLSPSDRARLMRGEHVPEPEPVDAGPLGLLEVNPERPPFLRVREAEHFAPFPSDWPRRLILGWSPTGICTVCDTGRFPVVESTLHHLRDPYDPSRPGRHDATDDGMRGNGYSGDGKVVGENEVHVVGYACACTPRTDHGPAGGSWNDPDEVPRVGKRAKPDGSQNLHKARRPRVEYHLDRWTPPPTRPPVVLDFFGGTGTTALVASVHGRVGITCDLSWDYSRIAQWRTRSAKHRAKVQRRTTAEAQDAILFDEPEATIALGRDVAQPVRVHTRADDPTTSKRAAVNVMPRAGTQKVRVLEALAARPETGMTGDDLCAVLGDKNGSSWRSRLASLREDYDPPLVERLDVERATRSGELAYVHRITEAGQKVLDTLRA